MQRRSQKHDSARKAHVGLRSSSDEPCSPSSGGSRILALEAQTGKLRQFCGGNSVLMTNEDSPWADTVKVEVHHVVPQEEPETVALEHCISLKLNGLGTLEWKLDGKKFVNKSYSASEMCLLSKGTPVWARWQEPGEFLVVAIPPAFAMSVAEEATLGHNIEFTNPWTFRDSVAEHLIKTMWLEMKAGCPAGRLFGESLATAFTAHLLRHYGVLSRKMELHRGGLLPATLRKVKDYVETHLHEDLSIRHLAALTQLSSYHFAHVFRQTTGVAPHHYVLQQRVERAKDLLKDTELPLTEVAFLTGFPSQAHLTVMFRKFVGCTPGSYRGVSTSD